MTRPLLTAREVEILSLIIDGHSNRQASEIAGVQKRTVDFHLANIYGKLSVHNRMQAAREAQRLGLLAVTSK